MAKAIYKQGKTILYSNILIANLAEMLCYLVFICFFHCTCQLHIGWPNLIFCRRGVANRNGHSSQTWWSIHLRAHELWRRTVLLLYLFQSYIGTLMLVAVI